MEEEKDLLEGDDSLNHSEITQPKQSPWSLYGYPKHRQELIILNDNAADIADLIDSTENIAPSLLRWRPTSSLENVDRVSSELEVINISQDESN